MQIKLFKQIWKSWIWSDPPAPFWNFPTFSRFFLTASLTSIIQDTHTDRQEYSRVVIYSCFCVGVVPPIPLVPPIHIQDSCRRNPFPANLSQFTIIINSVIIIIFAIINIIIIIIIITISHLGWLASLCSQLSLGTTGNFTFLSPSLYRACDMLILMLLMLMLLLSMMMTMLYNLQCLHRSRHPIRWTSSPCSCGDSQKTHLACRHHYLIMP